METPCLKTLASVWLALVLYHSISTADVHTTTVVGTLTPGVENGCILVSAFSFSVDCSYDGHGPAKVGPPLEWVGPTLGAAYFSVEDPHSTPSHTPIPGDQLYAPPLSGTLSVDDRNTRTGMDDTIQGTLTIGPAVRSHLSVSNQPAKQARAVESWATIRHTLAITAVDHASPNAEGGFDYTVGRRGFPSRICRSGATDDCFPSTEASHTADGKWGKGTWQGAGTQPLGRSGTLGGNVGAQTTATIEGYQCRDAGNGDQCAHGVSIWGAAEDPGWDNLVLFISTNRHGQVLQAEGFWTNEYRIEAGPENMRGPPGEANSWFGGFLTLQPARVIQP